MKNTKPKENLRIVPTGNNVLSNKEMNMETYIAMQDKSKREYDENGKVRDEHRYVYKNDISLSGLAREYDIDVKTLRKNIKNLEKLGYLDLCEYKGEEVWKIKNGFDDGYLLFEGGFLDRLVKLFTKNLIKVYLQYYKYTSAYGAYKMTQADTLKAIGLSETSNKNRQLISDINFTLEKLGLINIETIEIKGKKSYQTIQKIVAIKYYETDFYKSKSK